MKIFQQIKEVFNRKTKILLKKFNHIYRFIKDCRFHSIGCVGVTGCSVSLVIRPAEHSLSVQVCDASSVGMKLMVLSSAFFNNPMHCTKRERDQGINGFTARGVTDSGSRFMPRLWYRLAAVRVCHPERKEKGGVCIWFLFLWKLKIICVTERHLHEQTAPTTHLTPGTCVIMAAAKTHVHQSLQDGSVITWPWGSTSCVS